MTPESNMITIASGKGGVGKTWLSISLASALARENQSVLLFDGDLGLANVDVQLGLVPDQDLGDLLSGRATLTKAVSHYDATGFDVLAGKSGSGALSNMRRERLDSLRQHLRDASKSYDQVILDMAAGVDTANISVGSHGGMTLVVLTGEPTSLTDAYAFMKLRRMRDPGADMRIVINNAPDKESADKAYSAISKACATFLQFRPPLLGTVLPDSHVGAAIRSQSDIFSRYPQSDAARQVTTLARALLAEQKRSERRRSA
ncbi:MAG: AAA family ATPase [Sphingomonadales bacterium]